MTVSKLVSIHLYTTFYIFSKSSSLSSVVLGIDVLLCVLSRRLYGMAKRPDNSDCRTFPSWVMTRLKKLFIVTSKFKESVAAQGFGIRGHIDYFDVPFDPLSSPLLIPSPLPSPQRFGAVGSDVGQVNEVT